MEMTGRDENSSPGAKRKIKKVSKHDVLAGGMLAPGSPFVGISHTIIIN